MNFETMDLSRGADEIRRDQLGRLGRSLERNLSAHPTYSRLIGDDVVGGLIAGDEEALHRIPPTTKDDFVSDPEAFRLQLQASDDPASVLWDVAYTAGTSSGRPAPLYQTAWDFRGILLAQARIAEIRGLGSHDHIMNLYPLTPTPHGAWMRCNHAAAVIGASVTVAMGGSASMGFPVDRRLDEIVDLTIGASPTVLWGVPSYIRTVLRAIAERGERLPGLRLLAVSGEPCPPGLRADLELLASQVTDRPVVVSDNMGASEMQAGLIECRPGSGHHNPAPELFLFESITESGEPVPDGEEGLLALTHVDRRGTMLLRFLVGDRVVLTREPCSSCGRGGERIVEHRGRFGTRTKIRGNLVDLQRVAVAVEAISGVNEYQIRVRGPEQTGELDELLVLLEGVLEGTSVHGQVVESVARTVGVRPRVESVEPGSLGHGGLKVRRIIDERSTSVRENEGER